MDPTSVELPLLNSQCFTNDTHSLSALALLRASLRPSKLASETDMFVIQ